jgi:dihydroneopterin aldolase
MPSSGSDRDRIELRGLRVVGTIGVLSEERLRAQPFEVDVDLYADLSAAGRSDDLTDTVDYGAVTRAVEEVVATERHQLLERVAQRIAEVVLDGHPLVDEVDVTVRKLRPPVAHDLSTSGVRVRRRRSRGG